MQFKNKQKVLIVLKQYLSEMLNIPVESISDDHLLVDDLGVSSMIMVQLYVTLQEDYGINMSDELDLSSKYTVSQIADEILKLA